MPEFILNVINPDRPDVIDMLNEADAYYATLYPNEHNYLLDINALMQPNIKFVCALLDGTVIGCGAIRIERGYAEVKRMYVKPAFRGASIGYQVLIKLESLAKELGLNLIRLETGIYQTDAHRFYERSGYIRCGRFGNYPDNSLSLFYEKQL